MNSHGDRYGGGGQQQYGVNPTELEPLGAQHANNAPQRRVSVDSGRLPQLKSCGTYDLRSATRNVACLSMLAVAGSSRLLVKEADDLPDIGKGTVTEDVAQIILLTFVVICLLQVIFCIVLLCGSKKQNKNCLCPWLIFELVYMPVMGIFNVIMAIFLLMMGEILYGVGILLYVIVCIVVKVYFMLLVKSYYRELQCNGPVDIGHESTMQFFMRQKTEPANSTV